MFCFALLKIHIFHLIKIHVVLNEVIVIVLMNQKELTKFGCFFYKFNEERLDDISSSVMTVCEGTYLPRRDEDYYT